MNKLLSALIAAVFAAASFTAVAADAKKPTHHKAAKHHAMKKHHKAAKHHAMKKHHKAKAKKAAK